MNEEQKEIINGILRDLNNEDKRLEYAENEIKDKRVAVARKIKMFSTLLAELD